METFINELNLIKDASVRLLTEKILNQLPKYFFEVPASSTGKYHPKFAEGPGGLVRHTKAAVKIANELFNLEMFSKLLPNRDLIISALILHDGLKHGDPKSEFTKFEHPALMKDFIMANDDYTGNCPIIAALVFTHMGQWNTNKYSSMALPKPESDCQKFVHLCDYLASRRFIDIDFN